MLIICFSTTAYAKTFPDITKDNVLKEAVGVLSSYNILDGYPDGSFLPDKYVTRAEMAKIVTVAAGFYEYSRNMTSVYVDMEGHWAENYVELANVLNIVKGISPNMYGPDNIIKFEEAYTMVIRLLGYTDESLGGNWPSNYYKKAVELNLFQNIDTAQGYATRRDVSIMLYNALNLNLVKIKDNNAISNTNKPLLSLLGKKETKNITLNDLKNESFDFTDYLFNKWDVYYDIKGNVVHAANPVYNEFLGNVTSLLSNRVIFVTDDYGNVKAFQLSDVPIVVNGEKSNFNNLSAGRLKVVYEDGTFNGNVVGIIAYKETDVMVINKSNLYKEGTLSFAGKNLPVKSNNELNLNKLHVSGDAAKIQDIQVNDVVYFYESKASGRVNTLTLNVVRKQVEGKVTQTRSENKKTYYTVNDVEYAVAESLSPSENASVNDKVNLVLDKNNNIIKLDILSFGKKPSTWGIVLSSTNAANNNASARILDKNGNLKTYSLADNSGVVKVIESDEDLSMQTYLKKNDFVKFDIPASGPVKIIDYVPSSLYIANNYNEQDKMLSNGYKLSADTFIVYEANGKYQILQPNQLGTYIEGKASVGYNGNIDALYLTRGIKTANETMPSEVPETFSGKIYGMIKSITKVDDTISNIQFYNNATIFTISNTSATGKNIKSFLNYYVKVDIASGVINGIEKVTPETDKVKITQIYSAQIQIDSITYMEYSNNLSVFICSTDKSGNITGFKTGAKTDLKPGSIVQLYDIYGNYDGIIDIVIVYN